MIALIQLVAIFACLQCVHLHPIIREESSQRMMEDGMMAGGRNFIPYRDAILSPYGMLDSNVRVERSQGQRKKAVDSTFIRFGRSFSASEGEAGRIERSAKNYPSVANLFEDSQAFEKPESPSDPSDFGNFKAASVQKPLLNYNGCRVDSWQELMRALMTDPSCIRAFQKAKKENVNDTFIRFGKREAPPEKEFEPINSSGEV